MTVWVSEKASRTCVLSGRSEYIRTELTTFATKFWVTRTTFAPSFPQQAPCGVIQNQDPPVLAIGDVPSPEACFQACQQYSDMTYRPDGPDGFDCTCLSGGGITPVVCGPTTNYLFSHPVGSEVSPPNPSGWVKRSTQRGHRQARHFDLRARNDQGHPRL